MLEAFRHPAEPLSGPAAGEQEQEDGYAESSDAQGGAAKPPRTEPGPKTGDHRRPRFQSSSRA
jgi:hypothetical protein